MGYNYIILSRDIGGVVQELPIFYPDVIPHIDMAEAMVTGLKIIVVNERYGIKVASAGNAEIEVVSCHGGSHTLGIESRPEDTRVANLFPYMHGM